MNNWEQRFDQYMIDISAGTFSLSQKGWDLVKSFISQELNKAREEGRQELKNHPLIQYDGRGNQIINITKAIEKARTEGIEQGKLEVKALAGKALPVRDQMVAYDERNRILQIVEEMKKPNGIHPIEAKEHQELAKYAWSYNQALEELIKRIN